MRVVKAYDDDAVIHILVFFKMVARIIQDLKIEDVIFTVCAEIFIFFIV